MNDPELDIIIDQLESRADLTDADFGGVSLALTYLLPDALTPDRDCYQDISTAEGVLLVVDAAYPNWTVKIQGRANDRDGHWRCSLRESDTRDNDAIMGLGRSPVLVQAMLAAVLRLRARLKDPGDGTQTD